MALCISVLTSVLTGCAPETRTADVATIATPANSSRWYKGNLHTHSLWSDGDDYPEMIVNWYKEAGYDFLAISDHNTIASGEKWISVPDSGQAHAAFERYRERFGDEWVETRAGEEGRQVRLKTFDEFRGLLEDPGRFLMIRSEEITDGYEGKPIHVNATNIAEQIEPQGGSSVLGVMQNNVDAVLEQRQRTGRDMFPHINHPNFYYAITPQDLIALEGEKFFEVYNGHPLVNNHGDDDHPSTERMWDIVNSHRLAEGRGIMYGLATDDAHHYHEHHENRANAGRGWVVVRARDLTPEAMVQALERGDFYASTGVSLSDVSISGDTIRIEIEPDGDASFRTEFIGTRRGFAAAVLDGGGRASDEDDALAGNDHAAQAGNDHAALTSDDTAHPHGERYGDAIGETLSVSEGTTATYVLQGDELYVRARITSSRAKANGLEADEQEMAWTQPVQPGDQN